MEMEGSTRIEQKPTRQYEESKFWSFCDKVIIGRLQSFQQVSLITQWFCINDTRSSFNVINNMENLLPYVIE